MKYLFKIWAVLFVCICILIVASEVKRVAEMIELLVFVQLL